MNDDRDPSVQQLFANAPTPPGRDGFAQGVMAKIARRERMVVFVRLLLLLPLLVAAWLVEEHVMQLVRWSTGALLVSPNPLVAQLVQPILSPAGIAAIALLAFRGLFGRLSR